MLTSAIAALALVGSLLYPATEAPTSRRMATPDPSAPIEVVGDPAQAAYLGSGGLFVDSTFTGDPLDRQQLAECADCRWWLTPVCWRDPRNADAGCRVVATCPPGWVAMGIWFASASAPPRVVGRYCLGPRGPVTPQHITDSITGNFVRRLPTLRPGQQPAVSITGLATLFRSGQAVSAGPWWNSVAGFNVQLQASTTWTWEFGDGTTLVTRSPGGTYPTRSVQHNYRRAGIYRVSVRSDWVGNYSVDGIGPFLVSPSIRQTMSLTVVVRQAKAVLINPA